MRETRKERRRQREREREREEGEGEGPLCLFFRKGYSNDSREENGRNTCVAIFSIDFIAERIGREERRTRVRHSRARPIPLNAAHCLERLEMGREDSCSEQWPPCGINEWSVERRCVPVTILFCPKADGGHEPAQFHHPDIYRFHSALSLYRSVSRLYIVAPSFTTG